MRLNTLSDSVRFGAKKQGDTVEHFVTWMTKTHKYPSPRKTLITKAST